MSAPQWEIGLEVTVAPRTWPGINKPGGHGKIVNIHYTSQGIVDTLDVRYTLGKRIDSNLDTKLVKPHIQLDRGCRSRRGRDFFAGAHQTKARTKITQLQCKPEREEQENIEPIKVKECKKEMKAKKNAPKRDSKPPQQKNSSKTATGTSSRQREVTLPDSFPKKKKSKSNGNHVSVSQTSKRTPAMNTSKAIMPILSAGSGKKRDEVPTFVVTKPSSSLVVFSPLAVGREENIESPMGFSPTSKEKRGKINAQESPFGCNSHRKTLKNVFQDQKQDANKYTDSLVGNKPPKLTRKEESFRPTCNGESRRIDDLKACLWKVMGEKDGELPVDEIQEFGQREEIAVAIRDLTLEGRLMESDGVLYQIE